MAGTDISGKRFGRLRAINVDPSNPTRWICKCDCGTTKSISKPELTRTRGVRSCGCLHRESLISRNTTHGRHGRRTYFKWKQMRRRVNNPRGKDSCYRGITVCDRWNDYANFLADMGEAPEGYTLDRIDSSKGYSPDNCRWATWQTQMNNKSNNRKYTHNGYTLSIAEWSRKSGINYQTLISRLNRGIPIEQALSR